MTIRIFSFIAIFLIYGLSFFQQERLFQKTLHQLPFPLPARIQKVVLGGFLRQLGAEMLYIKTAVFLGGREAGRDPESYASSLAQRFSVISRLHPEFIDTYYLCESSLSYIDPEYTRKANRVLERGMAALPDNWILPFFLGFNHFYYLNEPKEAAMILKPASQLPSAPPWLGHLASVLAAEGGDIYAGLIWLKAMLATEENEDLRKRYREDIAIFEQALSILRATFEYRNRYNQPPPTLEDLVPEFLPHIPQLDGRYVLSWTPPTLRLLRSNPKQQPAKK
jgi:hypothetical protein